MIYNIMFENEAVRLDGKHFVDCVFTNCNLEYTGGDLTLERVTLKGCRHTLLGDARRTATYMRTVGLIDEGADQWTEWMGRVS